MYNGWKISSDEGHWTAYRFGLWLAAETKEALIGLIDSWRLDW
jgi:hypothetical protein